MSGEQVQWVPPVGSPEDRARAELSRRVWRGLLLRALPAFAVAVVVVEVLPLHRGTETAPPIRTLLLIAMIVAAALLTALVLVIQRDLRLPWQVAVYAAVFNAAVIGVKFVLAPRGLYEVNRTRSLSFELGKSDGALLAAGTVFVLYALALWVVYRIARRPLMVVDPMARRGRKVVLWVVVGVVALTVLTGGSAVLLAVLVLSAGVEYLDFVFSSALSLLVALWLAVATAMATMSFRSAAERARALGDAGVVTSLFWVCLAFLALYHVLWVVVILLITSIWPLRVVVPK